MAYHQAGDDDEEEGEEEDDVVETVPAPYVISLLVLQDVFLRGWRWRVGDVSAALEGLKQPQFFFWLPSDLLKHTRSLSFYLWFDLCDAEVGQMVMKHAAIQWLDHFFGRAELENVPPLRGNEELDAVSRL